LMNQNHSARKSFRLLDLASGGLTERSGVRITLWRIFFSSTKAATMQANPLTGFSLGLAWRIATCGIWSRIFVRRNALILGVYNTRVADESSKPKKLLKRKVFRQAAALIHFHPMNGLRWLASA
jgi:hypothetical protein